MNLIHQQQQQQRAEGEVDRFRKALGPFVVAAEATPTAIVFTNAGGEGHPVVFANEAFLTLTGFERDDIVGRPFSSLLCSTDPATLDAVGELFDDGSDPLDIQFNRKDGGTVWTAISVNPVPDINGRAVQHCISFVDLSAQNKRLRREREALHVLYEHTPGFIAISEGPEHRFTFANAAYQNLVGHRDLFGLPVIEALPELGGQHIARLLDRVYATGEPYLATGLSVRLQREPGAALEERFVDFIYQPVRGSDDRIIGLFCEGHDVTEQRAVTEQIERLQSEVIHLSRIGAMGTMGATLAHELAQPLVAIASYAAACSDLNRDGEDPDRIAECLEAIAKGAQRAGDIIRQVREMTVHRRGQREHFDLADAVRESVLMVQAGACAGVSIADGENESARLDADRVQVEQVIMNLLRNGCEAIGEGGGSVIVSTSVKGGQAVISVRDSGPGISPEKAERLFTWCESSKPDGMGIGLSICRTIVQAHGGTLWLEDSGPKGTCFAFALPIAEAATDPVASTALAGALAG